FLQKASQGVDQDNQSESIRECQDLLDQERAFAAGLEELRSLHPLLETLVRPAAAMQELRRRVEEMRLRNITFKQQLEDQDNTLQSCVSLWSSFQQERETLIGRMNTAENTMSSFSSARAASLQEAEDKFHSYKSLLSQTDSAEQSLNVLREKASELEPASSECSKAVAGHSVSSLWQRLTRLRSVARAQQRALEDTVKEWRNFNEKAATRAALQSLLEYHDSYSRELEREQSSLALLCQHTLCLRGQEEEEEGGEEREKKEEAEEEEEEMKERQRTDEKGRRACKRSRACRSSIR
ncbi:hypothetical protein CRUP_007930, partial [Coryphaenoides rupestris]